ncbi:hypothetical protein VHEMI04368 [[Torrubiella] hemipterigena]|uniref:Uncharacterized protein n=1 Tax=[Torrubiella] hemipterigena TaxID=1531966 RepID=A0A0A1TE18_9HYPO|nr:hypothetical protein VHEMI04368 [[Torrubiella] hemipterigena]
MQTKTFLAAAMALPAFTEAASCVYRADGSAILRRYKINADGVDDVPGICGGLWDNMNGQGACHGAIPGWCNDNGGGKLEWVFDIGVACNSGAVEAVWWEATKNRFGDIHCSFGPI